MKKESGFEVYTDTSKDPEIFSFSESENTKQFLNENYVFHDEENASQTSTDLNTSSYGSEENASSNSSSKQENNDDSNRNEDNNPQTESVNSSTTSSSTSSIASSSASTASSAAASSSGVMATIASTATVAVVAVVGGGAVMKEPFKQPTICEFQNVVVEDNHVDFVLKLGTDEVRILSGEENDDSDCIVEISYNVSLRYYDEVEVKNFGMFSGQFSNLEYDTEYCLNVYRPGLLGAEREYVLQKGYVLKTPKKGEDIAVESISLSQDEATLNVGDELQLNVSYTPEYATDLSVTWSSSDVNVVTVSDGLIKANGVGTATITAAHGELKATCVVRVTGESIPVESISITPESTSMLLGSDLVLGVDILPEDATDKIVSWYSDNSDVITVENGIVHAVGVGTTYVVAYQDDIVSERCTITVVKESIPVESIEFDQGEIEIETGQSMDLSVTILPLGFTDEVRWESSNRNAAVISPYSDDPTRAELTTFGTGETTITVTAGNQSADCFVNVVPKRVPCTSVELSETEVTLNVDYYKRLEYTCLPGLTTDEAQWTIESGEGVVEIYEIRTYDCQIHALTAGKAVVRLTMGDVYDECTFTVNAPTVSVSGINFTQTQIPIEVGNSDVLTYSITPSNATNQNVSFYSFNEDVASVDETGRVTAHSAGETSITVKTEDGNFEDSCTIIVSEPKTISLEDITFEQGNYSIHVDETIKLNLVYTPENATNKNVEFVSDDTGIVEVDQTGSITGIGVGETLIHAVSYDGSHEASCLIVVSQPQIVPVEGVSLDKTGLEMVIGGLETLTATVHPDNAEDKSVSWDSNDVTVVEVDQYGQVHALGTGSATITVTTTDGGYKDTCNVVVGEAEIPVTGVTLNPDVVELLVGQEQELEATITPENATNQELSWSSDDENVAIVDDGVVTGVGAGECTITVSAGNGSFTDTCEVRVTQEEPVLTNFLFNIYTTNVSETRFAVVDMEYENVSTDEFRIQITADNSTYPSDLVPVSSSVGMDCFNGSYYMLAISDDDEIINDIVNSSYREVKIITSSGSFDNPIFTINDFAINTNKTGAAPEYSYEPNYEPVGESNYASIKLPKNFYSIYSSIKVIMFSVQTGERYEINIDVNSDLDSFVQTTAPVTLDAQEYQVTIYGVRSGNVDEVLIFNERVYDFGLH